MGRYKLLAVKDFPYLYIVTDSLILVKNKCEKLQHVVKFAKEKWYLCLSHSFQCTRTSISRAVAQITP